MTQITSWYHMSKVITPLLAALMMSAASWARTTVDVAGATDDENSQLLLAGDALESDNLEVQINGLTRVLERHAMNRAARFLRAGLFIGVGNTPAAAADLEALEEVAPRFPLLDEAWASLAAATGSRDDELAAWEAIAQEQARAVAVEGAPQDSLRHNPQEVEARIAELRGESDRAEELLRALVGEGRKQRWPRLSMLGRFYVRQGRYGAASDAFETALARVPDAEGYGGVHVQLRTSLALAQWAAGRREDALRTGLAAGRRVLLDPSPRNSPGSYWLPGLALICSSLTAGGVGSAEDRRDAELILKEATAIANAVGRFSLGPTCRVAQGRVTVGDALRTVDGVLGRAPKLDWALTAALHLYLSDPVGHPTLLERLPEGGIHRQIAVIETEAREDEPATAVP